MTTKQRVWLRADASAEIGYGHFVRTLALGQMLGRDFELIFATRRPTPHQLDQIEAVCDRCVALGDDHWEAFSAQIEAGDVVVVDNYFFTTDYQRQIKHRGAKLVCVDDMHDKHYVADVVINHGLTDRSLFSVEAYTRLCLGLEWALLRPPFLEPHEGVRDPGRVAVCFGGADAYGFGERCRDLFEEQGRTVELVQGMSADQVAMAFARAEWAVVSASGAMIEAFVLGAKVAAGWYVDNQHALYDAFVAQQQIVPLGDLRRGSLAEKLEQALWCVPPCPPQVDRSGIKRHYRQLFFGLSLRYADYRTLSLDQHQQVWSARNRQEVRTQMDNPASFGFDAHRRFVSTLHTRSDLRHWAVWFGDRLVGNVNLTLIDLQTQEIGIFVVPEFWGTGVAEAMERFAAQQTEAQWLEARVRHTNPRSKAYFERLGYQSVDQTADHDVLRRKIK